MKKTVFMISLVAGLLLTSCASKKELQACQEDNKALQANYQDTKEQLDSDTEALLSTARRLMGGIRIVTKGGELVEASGAMTGGTVKTQTLKFGAASQDKLDEVSAELRTANQSLDMIKEMADHI